LQQITHRFSSSFMDYIGLWCPLVYVLPSHNTINLC
jgi:hypothetical protein